jgi:DNA-binding MarR family transcriptional regulator
MFETATDPATVAEALRPTLLQLGRELRRETRSAGISPEQVALLVAVKQSPGIGIRGLAARERVSPPAMTKQVDRLERDGLVTRTTKGDDRRCVAIALTVDGHKVLRRVRSRRTAWLTSRLRALEPEQLEAIEAAVAPLRMLLTEVERP